MDKSVTSESKVQPNSCLLFPDLTDSAVYGPFREALLEVALYIRPYFATLQSAHSSRGRH